MSDEVFPTFGRTNSIGDGELEYKKDQPPTTPASIISEEAREIALREVSLKLDGGFYKVVALQQGHFVQLAITAAKTGQLAPASCGVSGHFRFQMNGTSCLMCQREQSLVTAATEKLKSDHLFVKMKLVEENQGVREDNEKLTKENQTLTARVRELEGEVEKAFMEGWSACANKDNPPFNSLNNVEAWNNSRAKKL